MAPLPRSMGPKPSARLSAVEGNSSPSRTNSGILAAASEDSRTSGRIGGMLRHSTVNIAASFREDISKAAALRAAQAEESLTNDSTSHGISFNDLLAKASKDGVGLDRGAEIMRMETSKHNISAQMKNILDVVLKGGRTSVMRRHVLKAVAQDDSQQKTCVKLPMTLLYSIVYILFYQAHYHTSSLHLQELAIRTSIGDAPAQAENSEDIYRWLDGTLFPYLWSCHTIDLDSESPQHHVDTDHHANVTQLFIAGVRLRTARGPLGPLGCGADLRIAQDAVPCAPASPRTDGDSAALLGWRPSSRRLHGAATGSAPSLAPPPSSAKRRASRRAFARRESRLLQGAPPRRRRGQAAAAAEVAARRERRRLKEMLFAWMGEPVSTHGSDGVFTRIVPMSLEASELTAVVDSFRDAAAPLVDDSTLFLSVDFPLVAPDISKGVLSVASVTFMFSRGGGIYTTTTVSSLPLTLKRLAGASLAVWLILLAYLTVMQVTVMYVAAKNHALMATLNNFASLVDFTVIAVGWVIAASVAWESIGMRQFDADLQRYWEERREVDHMSLPDFDTRWLEALLSNSEGARWIAKESITLVAVYTLLLVLRFLVATMGHPRLALVVRTLLSSMTDLVHLLFMCMIVFLAYVMSGTILFGRRMEEFSTFGGSFGYCLQIVYQRQFDFDAITQEDAVSGAFWVCSFVFVLVLIMVNVVLTMIFSNYAEVHETLNKSDNIYQFAMHLLQKLRNQSVWVSNAQLLGGLIRLPQWRPITCTEIQYVVPEVSSTQLGEIWRRASAVAIKSQIRMLKVSVVTFIAETVLELADLQRAVRHMASCGEEEKRHSQRRVKGAKTPVPVPEPTTEEDAVAEEAVFSAEFPREAPAWIGGALAEHLRAQQAFMASTTTAMEEAMAKMAARGIVGDCGFPTPPPPRPDLGDGAPPVSPSAAAAVNLPRPTRMQVRGAKAAA